MGEINLAMAGFYRFLLYDRSSFPQIHLHFKGKKQKRMRHSQYSRGFSKKKRFLLMRLVTKEIISSMLSKNRSTNLLMLALEINSSLICS